MSIEDEIEAVGDALEGDAALERYHRRHGVRALGILTVYDEETARREAARLAGRVRNKVVVEIGAGVGLLALEVAKHARQVYAIEADPAWTWVFVEHLIAHKPANLTWIFGAAETVAEWLRADLAIVYTRSDVAGMAALAARMAPEVIRGPLERRGPFVEPPPAEEAL